MLNLKQFIFRVKVIKIRVEKHNKKRGLKSSLKRGLKSGLKRGSKKR